MASFLRDQPVLCVAALVAAATAVVVPPSPAYADYMNWRVLGLLFCLMLCVAGLEQAGLFQRVARLFLRGGRSLRFVGTALVMLCFFTSMLVTNDVALLTFVPFTLFLFKVSGNERRAAPVVVLQTLAANLGSMVTPFGNPQNLFVYEHYSLSALDFMSCILPFAAVSLVGLAVCSAVFCKGPAMRAGISEDVRLDVPALALFGALFVLSVGCVLGLAPLPAVLAASVVLSLAFRRTALAGVNYGLLATFVLFFVISGNLANIQPVREALTGMMQQAPFAVGLLASQVISNVPAAVLLAPFTSSWQQLLLGVDIGGLGTPVASLASLISLELFMRARLDSAPRYLALFTVANVAFLALNIIFGLAIGAL